MGDSPLPPVQSKFQYDSFDSDQASVSPSPTLTIPQGRETSERAILIGEVVRLYRERYRLARMHRKAELRVATSLKRRRHSEAGEDDVDDEEEGGGSHIDWVGQANKARTALLEADQIASGQELQYRLLLEDAKTKTEQASFQAEEALKIFTEMQRHLVKRSFSALPPEKDRQKTVEELLQRQNQIEDQLKQARTSYFSLAIKKQEEEEEMRRRQDTNDGQVSVAEMLRLVVETEAFTEEIGVQETSLLTQKSALKTTETIIRKRIQEKKETLREISKVTAKVETLKTELRKRKEELKKLTEKQAKSRKKANKLTPSTRLLSDPVLARDLEVKLSLKEELEDELNRLKKTRQQEKIFHIVD